VEYTGDAVQENLAELEENRIANIEQLADLREDYADVLEADNPEFRRLTLLYADDTETPSELVQRTIGNKNPGLILISRLQTEISRFKLLTKDEPPIIAGDEITDAEYLDLLV